VSPLFVDFCPTAASSRAVGSRLSFCSFLSLGLSVSRAVLITLSTSVMEMARHGNEKPKYTHLHTHTTLTSLIEFEDYCLE